MKNLENLNEIKVPKSAENSRLDTFLAQFLNTSRAQISRKIQNKEILLNSKKPQKCGILLKKNDFIQITAPQNLDSIQNLDSMKNSMQIESNIESSANTKQIYSQISVLYEDSDLLVINKPNNLIVHRANTNDSQPSVVSWLISQKIPLSNIGTNEDEFRRGIVHRLDKCTSGALVIAKNNTTHRALAEQLNIRAMGRYYLALISPRLNEDKIIDAPLMRCSTNRLKYRTINDFQGEFFSTQSQIIPQKRAPKNAKSAKSAFFVLLDSMNLKTQLIGAKLFSGRTHQIRAHLAHINRHILGDYFYGFNDDFLKNLDSIKSSQNPKEALFCDNEIFLHARELYFLHPKSGELMQIFAPLPQNMLKFIQSHFKGFSDEIKLSEIFKNRF